MFLPECPFYVGIDWAAETHAVCVLDGAGTVPHWDSRRQGGNGGPRRRAG